MYARNSCFKAPLCTLRLQSGRYGPDSSAWAGIILAQLLIRIDVDGKEAARNDCGVRVAKLQEHSETPPQSSVSKVNVGTLDHRRGDNATAGASSAEGDSRGGACIVVRERESRLHGEGRQRVRGKVTVMPGGHL